MLTERTPHKNPVSHRQQRGLKMVLLFLGTWGGGGREVEKRRGEIP